MLRGGQCPPVARERARVAPRVHFGPGFCWSFELRSRPLTLEGNPSSCDPPCSRVGPQPGQGRRPLSLGLHHLGTQERVLLWLVMRGADGYEYPPSMRNELETSPTSKHADSISLFIRYVNLYFSLFVRPRILCGILAFAARPWWQPVSAHHVRAIERLPRTPVGVILLFPEDRGALCQES